MLDNQYTIQNLIGVGGSSRVYAAQDENGQDVAIKFIVSDNPNIKENAKHIIFNEYVILNEIGDHPNIVKTHQCNPEGVFFVNNEIWSAQYMAMEKCSNGSLSKIVRNTGSFSEQMARFFFVQICSAVEFLACKGFAHLDIKLANILLDEYYNTKLSDLGTAVNVSQMLGYTSRVCGTHGYMAPEITSESRDETFDGYSADIYSLGVCLHLLLTGEFPSENQCQCTSCDTSNQNVWSWKTDYSSDSMDIDDKTPSQPQNICKRTATYDHLSIDVVVLLDDMLSNDPWTRPTIDEIFDYDWVKSKIADDLPFQVYQEMWLRKESMTNINKA